VYAEYFGLKELPFSIAPDPRFLFMSEGHQEALAHLAYGIGSEGGFVLLTGEVGAGKTTVCRSLLDRMPRDTHVAFILNPKVTAAELLATVCDEFGIAYPAGTTSVKVFVDRINTFLLETHEREEKTVLIIEEAQNLDDGVLEQVRLLTNLETDQKKLLQIIMLGQPELQDKLARPEMKQLAQRITARYHLGPLTRDEVAAYITHRLLVAGVERRLFPQSVIDRVHRLSGGIPRLINVLCDRALLGAYVQGRDSVDRRTLAQAAREVFGGSGRRFSRRYGLFAGLAIVCVLAVLAVGVRSDKDAFPVAVDTRGSMSATRGELPSHEEAATFTEKAAMQALLRLWGVQAASSGPASCRQAEQKGLRCLRRKGSFNSLIGFNRPAVVTLADDYGREYFITITSVAGGMASFSGGTRSGDAEITEIMRRWSGNYTLLWRVPEGYRGDVRPGSRSEAVRWLGRHLALVRGGRYALLVRHGKRAEGVSAVRRARSGRHRRSRDDHAS
jgi:general secretion pathway protein A